MRERIKPHKKKRKQKQPSTPRLQTHHPLQEVEGEEGLYGNLFIPKLLLHCRVFISATEFLLNLGYEFQFKTN